MNRVKQQTFLAISIIVMLIISASCSQPPATPTISQSDIAATIEAAVAATVAAISAEAKDAPTTVAVIASPIVQATSEAPEEPTEYPTGAPTEVGIDPMITDTSIAVTPITATTEVTSPTLPITATVIVTATLLPTSTNLLTGTAVVVETIVPTTTVIPTSTVIATPTVEPTVTVIPTSVPTGTVEPTPSPMPTTMPTPPTSPTPIPTDGPPSTPTTMPATVFLGSHHSYRAGSSFVVVGEAINGGSSPVYGVTVIATFYDADNNLVGASESAALLPQTLPTQANPFRLQLLNAPANVDRYELTLRWDEITINTFDRATIISETINTSNGTGNGIEITGEIRNDHRSELRNLVVVATFYDATGAVVDVVTGQANANALAPGDTTTFSVQAQTINYATYLVQIEGMLWR